MRNFVILGLVTCSLVAFFTSLTVNSLAKSSSIEIHPYPNQTIHPQAERWSDFFANHAPRFINVPQVSYTSRDDYGVFVNVRNAGHTTLCYLAYGRSNAQDFRESNITGEWKAVRVDGCLTGLNEYEIPPNESVELYISGFDRTNGYSRALTCFTEKGTMRSELIVLATHDDLLQVPYIPSKDTNGP